jgi:pyrroloquinoline quinone biosynthesis protein D
MSTATAVNSATTSAATTGAANTAALPDHCVAQVARGLRLQWEPAQNCHVLLYPEGMVKLNQSAGEILSRCDGVRDLATLVAALEQAFSAQGLRGDVEAFLRLAAERGWVQLSHTTSAA